MTKENVYNKVLEERRKEFGTYPGMTKDIWFAVMDEWAKYKAQTLLSAIERINEKAISWDFGKDNWCSKIANDAMKEFNTQ